MTSPPDSGSGGSGLRRGLGRGFIRLMVGDVDGEDPRLDRHEAILERWRENGGDANGSCDGR